MHSPPAPLHHQLVFLLVAAAAGCGARTGLTALDAGDPCGDGELTRPCRTACGDGVETCRGGVFSGCTAPTPRAPGAMIALHGTVRDLRGTHPDMELPDVGDDRGIVEERLGRDRKPVYASASVTPTTSGRLAFNEWFHDVPGVNRSAPLDLVLRRRGAELVYTLDDGAFFPIDRQLCGNEGRPHNFHFTLEVHAEMTYRGGESFTFAGDDDLWAFIAGRLAIDLGGVHAQQSRTLRLDALAPSFGMTPGGTYPIDLFFAERHTTGSTLRIETTIVSFDACR